MFPDIRQALARHAAIIPDAPLYTFLENGDDQQVILTCREADRLARGVAARLLALDLRGERIVIALPSGLHYVVSMLGCLYAGVIAVPALPPSREPEAQRLALIAADCSPKAVILDMQRFAEAPVFGGMLLIDAADLVTDSGEHELADDIPFAGDEVAFLQYTSGSTGRPKGVRVSRRNLQHNCWLISELMGHVPHTGVLWLPLHHDMGLISGIFRAAFLGAHIVLMSPLHFMQRPVRWLRAMTQFGAVASSAPDFAFNMCVERIKPHEREGLDLSGWKFAFCGAEPIRQETLDRFVETFSPFGFRREALIPCYGLAETTLAVTARRPNAPPAPLLSPRQSNGGAAQAGNGHAIGSNGLVSCGMPLGEMDVRVVDVATLEERPAGEVGEIWISGPSVADDYWNGGPEVSPFGQKLTAAEDGKRFFRTGDLGFVDQGQLYVSGRLKNVILVRGRNLHAEDIEQSLSKNLRDADASACAAFPILLGNREELGLMIEVPVRGPASGETDLQGLMGAVCKTILSQHGVLPGRISIVKRGTIPRTSSGKLQRHACANMLSSGRAPPLAEWSADAS